MLKSAAKLLLLTSLISLNSCSVKMGSAAYVMRENKLGTAIVPMEDVKVKALQLQGDGSIKAVTVTIKTHTVVRVGIEFIGRDDQILTQEAKKFQAMVPDKDGALVLTVFTLDAKVAVKIGTATWTPPEVNKP